jgi:hypothetical protein
MQGQCRARTDGGRRRRRPVHAAHPVRRPTWALLAVLAAAWCATGAADKAGHMRYLSYAEGYSSLFALRAAHPSQLRVYRAAEAFPHLAPSTARCRSWTSSGAAASTPCETLIAELGGGLGPAVLVLGPLHGDERVAAAAAFHLITLLVTRVQSDPWIGRLMSTRRIFVVPLPAAAAYDKFSRFEEGPSGVQLDPAGDFPFARAPGDGGSCLQSTAARIVDALFRRHTFVVALQLGDTRSGRDAVSFSWSSPSTCAQTGGGGGGGKSTGPLPSGDAPCIATHATPDNKALKDVADVMSKFAGPGHLDNTYLATGARGDLAGAHAGGFLDYSYGSSARPDLVAACGHEAPTNLSHRAAAFIIEASRESAPDERNLGRLDDLYVHEPRGNVITRILRSALVGIDFAAPYVFWMNGDEDFEARGGIAHVRWSVGGAVTVPETWLTCRINNDPDTEWRTLVQTGESMWSQSFEDSGGLSFYRLHHLTAAPFEFRESLLLYKRLTPEQRAHGARLHLRADAVVDLEWAPDPSRPAVSHLVQLRTNTSWYARDGHDRPTRGRAVFSTATVVVDVPPVSGLAALLEYVWEFLVLALFMCIAPPAALAYCTRRPGGQGPLPSRTGFLMRQRMRRALRQFSRGDFAAEVVRLRQEQSKRLSTFRRNVSATNLIGVLISPPSPSLPRSPSSRDD